ncbi:MAG: DNA replication/repair protein RecF [Candidatus Dadabacteria bacterium]|nr:DNA replication/repair protein RecF [Candidatus Dadabacteria bacterium]
MKLRSLTLRNFRSYAAENFAFHDRVNLIYGENAQGKTNLLEAVHFLLAFRPFRQVRHEELITIGASEARIKGEIESPAGLDEAHIILGGEKRTIKLNGKLVYNASKALGRYNVVAFLPSDIELVKGSPQARRRYLDALIFSLEPAHLAELRKYHRFLVQRNAVLSRGRSVTPESLEIWDEKLIETGSRVISRRMEYAKKMTPLLARIYADSSGSRSEAGLRYATSFAAGDDVESAYAESLKASFAKDRARGHTTVGPHRDNLSFFIDGRDASVYASQGESKNFALALRASEIDLIKATLGKTPVLLLDDVTSELDERRRKFLFGMLGGFPGQIFITTTNPDEVLLKGEMKTFRIRKGRAEPALVKR